MKPKANTTLGWIAAIAASLSLLFAACSTQPAAHRITGNEFSSSEAIFVTNSLDDSINIYPLASRGDAPPGATIKGAATRLSAPVSIALDSAGKIYVLNAGRAGSPASIEVFATSANGDAAPVARIAGPATQLQSVNKLAVDAGGKIYVAIEVADVDSNPAGILIFPPATNGNVAPAHTIGGIDSKIQNPWGIAVDSTGYIFVAEAATTVRGRVLVFSPGSTGQTRPRLVMQRADVRLIAPTAIAVDATGGIYVANEEANTMDGIGISIFKAPIDSSGPILAASIGGQKTGLMDDPVASVSGIALDSRKNIYVTLPATRHNPVDRIVVFSAGSDGEVVPRAVIVGPSTKLSGPSSIAIGPYLGANRTE